MHYAVVQSLEGRDPTWCGDGLDGLGCALVSVAAWVFVAIILGGLTNYAILRVARVQHAGATAALATLAFVAWWGFIDSVIPGTNLAFVPIAVPPMVLNLLAAGLFRVVAPRGLAFVVTAVLIVVAAGPLWDAGNQLDAKRNRDDRDSQIRHADFVTYDLGWVPPGYEVNDVQFHHFGHDAPFADVTAIHGNNDADDPSPFEVTSFHVPDYFRPPDNCGADKPYGGEFNRPCRVYGTTTNGEPIYVDDGATFSNRQTFYVLRGATVITLDASAYDDEMPPITVQRIFDGLRPYRP